MLNCGLINKLRKNITPGTPGKYLVAGWFEFQIEVLDIK